MTGQLGNSASHHCSTTARQRLFQPFSTKLHESVGMMRGLFDRTKLWPAILGAACVGLAIGYWFASRQISLLTDGHDVSYPLLWRLHTITTVGMVVLAFFLGWLVLLRRLAPEIPESRAGLLWIAAQAPALSVLLGVPPGWAALGVVVAQLMILAHAARFRGLTELANRWAPHLAALAVITVVILFVAQVFSPLYQDSPMAVYSAAGQGDVSVTTGGYNAYIWSRLFSFSDFDYAAFGGAPQTPTRVSSFIVPALAFFLGLPGIDAENFHRVMAILQFACFVAGSFGCYLLCRVGFRLRYGISLLAGLSFILGNPYYLATLSRDPLAFVSAYAFLPYALLGMTVALHRNSPLAAAWAGGALALPYYVLAPHPETSIEALLTFGMITLGLLLLPSAATPFRRRIVLVAICATVALAAVLAAVLPIAVTALSEEMIVFGRGIRQTYLFGRTGKGIFSPTAYMLMLTVNFCMVEAMRQLWQRRFRPEPWVYMVVAGSFLFVWLGNAPEGLPWKPLMWLKSIGPFVILEPRFMIFAFFAFLMAAMFSADAFMALVECVVKPAGTRRHTDYWSRHPASVFIKPLAYLIFFALITVGLIDRNSARLSSGNFIDNPQGCPYELTLASRLANLPRLHQDSANTAYIRDRLIAFEAAMGEGKTPSLRSAAEPYFRIIRQYGEAGAASLEETEVVAAARALARTVDAASFGPGACIYPPMVTGDGVPKNKWVLRYNNDGYYVDLPSPYLRIRSATGRTGSAGESPRSYNSHLGIGPGLFLLDRSTYIDPRRTMGYPLMHALYLMPGNDYAGLPLNWGMDADEVLAPAIRHLTDISGIDVITVRAEAWDELAARDGLEVLPTWMPPVLDPHYVTLLNRNSYGMAFLATRITPIDPGIANRAEQAIKQYFRGGLLGVEAYRETVSGLATRLASLTERHAVLLERAVEETSLPPSGADHPGQLTIRGIIGPRAAFAVECQRTSCLVGFNMAAVSGWRVFVDGLQVPRDRINFAFLGAEVPNGEHEILFLYTPGSAVIGELVTLLAVLLLLIVSLPPIAPSESGKGGRIKR